MENYNTGRQNTDDNIIRRMRRSCWIGKATTLTHTLRIYNTYCSSIVIIVARKRLIVTSYVYCLSCRIQYIVSDIQHI